MREATVDTSDSSTNIRWSWNASVNSLSDSSSVEWEAYSDVETMIIEEAFQAGCKRVTLDSYTIEHRNSQ